MGLLLLLFLLLLLMLLALSAASAAAVAPLTPQNLIWISLENTEAEVQNLMAFGFESL